MKLLALVALTAALATPAQAQSLTRLRVAFDGFSMTSAPLYYAEQQGIFKKFGLDVTPAFVEGGSLLTQAVVGGSVDIAQNGYTPAAGAAVAGAGLGVIGGIFQTQPVPPVPTGSSGGAAGREGPSNARRR